jgi:mono/diheme cytochrome c family protein
VRCYRRWLGSCATFALFIVLCSCGEKKDVKGDPVSGKALFDYTCVACHYANSTVARAGPGLAGLYKQKTLPNGPAVTDANVERLIRDGSSLMPGYRNKISPEEMRNLIAYLRTL